MARPDDPDVRCLRALRKVGGDELASGRVAAGGITSNSVEALRAAGYQIENITPSAWRLVSSPAALIADDILATLSISRSSRIVGREVLVFEETNSTNDLAARAGEDGASEGLVIFAEKQRAGRGRLGRVWESRPRLGLWFSVLLRPAREMVDRWSELTFCAALAVARTAEAQTAQAARIKWPNDVLVNGRKVAGILLEAHHRQEPGYVVVGIGVNVLQELGDFDPVLHHTAGSLAMVGGTQRILERRVVAASLLENLEAIYSQWPSEFTQIMDACRERGCTPPVEGAV